MYDDMQAAKHKKRRKLSGSVLSIRISDDLKASLSALAGRDRRNLSQYVLIVLENHVATPRPLQVAPVVPHVPAVLPSGGSEPPRRIQDMARAHSKASIPPEVAKQIVESDGDWEGSDPQKQFVGTKVKI